VLRVGTWWGGSVRRSGVWVDREALDCLEERGETGDCEGISRILKTENKVAAVYYP
jgi:hypothetical protein